EKGEKLTEEDLVDAVTCLARLDGTQNMLPHPDFSRIVIRRFGEDEAEEVIAVNLAERIAACTEATPDAECRAADIQLQPGDLIELPVHEDRIHQPWNGFDEATRRFFKKALTYTIRVHAGGTATEREVSWTAPLFVQTPAGTIGLSPGPGPASMQIEDVLGERYPAADRNYWIREGCDIYLNHRATGKYPQPLPIPFTTPGRP
ncbi:MAG: hypothetical protein AAF492_14310, partial [Verrucomicrobiota bacterium]